MAGETIRTHVVLARELVEAVDRFVGQHKRSAFFAEAVEEQLHRERLGRALATTAGFLAGDAHPEWGAPEEVSAWVREPCSLDSDTGENKLNRYR